uniref:Uncharacterized protein n=1 Tax=Candidatus Kentrum sp. SD TaxID=2126332 RepID=A0A450Z518_9GAMM|nr:MAG: hypothetical protein BECKSD772F_GA0070984_11212 [Candidatus Kentron sp. SD]VFK48895.1 MAG: hypothetical protein BECKSD772E_GA0070983_11482 [Candidatus Kentron sp. SD]VFK80411.1 MAG: hypothetical protein BECKSD772D_GA0070982_11122 [Candidatus Kentron sp. SD]
MKSKLTENEPVELQDAEDNVTDIVVDDYKDLEIETLASSHERRLGWNRYALDKGLGFNEYD